MRTLESVRNPLVKSLIHLEKARERKKTGYFLVEGLRELRLALLNGFEVEQIFFCEKFISFQELTNSLPECPEAEWIQMLPEVEEKLLYRHGIPNVLGKVKMRQNSLDKLNLPAHPLILVVENIEKPGNLGAMLRTADATGADAVIVCDTSTDIFNPNVIRSSLGCVFSVPLVTASNSDTLAFLQQHKIRSFAAHLDGKKYHFNSNFSDSSAIVMGSEAFGLSEFWENNADEMIKIPMLGMHDSLNVSNAAAVLLYEAIRQRMLESEIRN